MLLLIDNYDSFTYNLVHYLGELGAETAVYRNDALSVDDALALEPEAIVLSPGPCDPDQAGICVELIKMTDGKIPTLGVCLGHQSIAQAFGADIIRASTPVHGKPSKISHDGLGLFHGLPKEFEAIRYHSLTVDPDTMPDTLAINAKTNDKVVMGISHNQWPVYGVQFHPESIDTEHGHTILGNFLNLSRQWRNAA
ncbi:MAG: aminodeoxychorismate/anthranilate synthase component II [Alphaproteobacteria bacterium]|nr:aminodeoxychorismate/anthranilate synthase component II [Alphaproteobacteria bacterium]